MLALNSNPYGTADVKASLNAHGNIVITGKNTTDTVSVGGVYASNIGFDVGNRTFKPTAGTAPTTPTVSSTASASKPSTTAPTKKSYTTTASLTLNTASSLLADSGAGGSLVDMLA